MPGIVHCRQINAQCMFIALELKQEALPVGRLVSAVFVPSHCPPVRWEMWRGVSWVFSVTYSLSSRATNTGIYCCNQAKPQKEVAKMREK